MLERRGIKRAFVDRRRRHDGVTVSKYDVLFRISFRDLSKDDDSF